MNIETQKLLDRTFNFGVDVLTNLSKYPYNEVLRVPKRQLVRAATSIGANYEEAQAAESKKDFIHKIGIICKETQESNYWSRVLAAVSTDPQQKALFEEYKKESAELKKIFTSIKLSAQGNRKM